MLQAILKNASQQILLKYKTQLEKINALEENEIIIASGTSCRQQVLQHNNSSSMHIAEFLSDSLTVHRKK